MESCTGRIAALEMLLEDTSTQLAQARDEIRDGNRFLQSVLRSMDSAVIITDLKDRITSVGGSIGTLTGRADGELIGLDVADLFHLEGPGPSGEAALTTSTGIPIPVLITTSELTDQDHHVVGRVFVATDISERKRLEVELRHAQKLESVGQLAAGVAHEINTPIQYIGDSVHFIGDLLTDLLQLAEASTALAGLVAGEVTSDHGRDSAGPGQGSGAADLAHQLVELGRTIDLDFAADEGPKAVTRTLAGVERVSSIVRALKQFAHPDGEGLGPTDLNEIVDTTLLVAANEYRYVADVTFERGTIPSVNGNQGDLAQVVLNLLVNAAHAIGDQVEGTDRRGTITLTTAPAPTAAEGDGVVLHVTDTGGGIPHEIRDRIHDPFFTTKGPGRGTGQGLAICHSIVVERHHGRLSFESEVGVGTTFTVWLPVAGSR